MRMIQTQIQTAFPWRFLLNRVSSLISFFSLLVFLFLQFVFSSLLLFANKSVVISVISLQSHIVVVILELILVSLPLLFHFIYTFINLSNTHINVFHYSIRQNWLYFLQRITAVVAFVFLVFHVYQTIIAYGDNLEGYQYIQELLVAHKTWYGLGLYWMAMLCSLFYFCQCAWSFLIDWGITANKIAQKMSYQFFLIIFVLGSIYIGFMVYQNCLLVNAL